jgi:penicillin-binding protein 2
LASSFGERRSPSHRFLPPDPRVTEPYRFTPQLALRVGVLAALALIVFAILFLRLWALQVLSGDRYLNAAQNNQLRTIHVEAPRGSILDRRGRTIVSNVPGTAVQIWTADLPDEGRYAMFRKLSKILRVPVPRLTKALAEGRDDPLTPILVKTAVHEDQVAALKERRAEFPGVEVVGTYLRDYEYRALAAQLLGYVGEISPEELERLEKDGYRPGEKIGKTGVEAAFDTYLRGTAGAAQIRVDSLGRPQGEGPYKPLRPGQPGNSVRLTIDIGLQRAAERALQEGIEIAYENKEWNANGGAIVALDPRDGAVLAMASNPTYKPSVYVGRVDPKKLEPLTVEKVAKERNYPGINRAIAGVYPPGSTFKPLTALAAISDGLLSPHEYIQCTPYAEYGLDKHRFDNWNPFTNAPMMLTTALSQSCDTYFYDIGNRYYLRGENERKYWTAMQEWAKKFGFGQAAGLDIGGEATGLLPTPAWRKRIGRTAWDKAWNPGDLIQLAIGQKDMTVTPLQMARFYAALANGGKLVTPYLVSAIEQPGNERQPPVTLRPFPPAPPQTLDVDPTALQYVREGLFEATHDAEGTSSGVFGSFPVPVAGKTGTAEKVVNLPGYPLGHQEDQAWWCGWGPFDGSTYTTRTGARRAPIVVCALIENGGHGGTAAAPAALKVFEHWFQEQAGVQGVVASD